MTDRRDQFETGVRALTDGDTHAAIESFQQACIDVRLCAASYNFLAQVYLAKGWHDEAIAVLDRAIEAHPSESDAFAIELRTRRLHALAEIARQ